MTINPSAKSARESARHGDGTFGHQVKNEPASGLSSGYPASLERVIVDDPFAPDLPGLTPEESATFRVLGRRTTDTLDGSQMTPEERVEYAVLADQVEVAGITPDHPAMPNCPVHSPKVDEFANPEGRAWGADASCAACTDPTTGRRRHLGQRLYTAENIGSENLAAHIRSKAAREQDKIEEDARGELRRLASGLSYAGNDIGTPEVMQLSQRVADAHNMIDGTRNGLLRAAYQLDLVSSSTALGQLGHVWVDSAGRACGGRAETRDKLREIADDLRAAAG